VGIMLHRNTHRDRTEVYVDMKNAQYKDESWRVPADSTNNVPADWSVFKNWCDFNPDMYVSAVYKLLP
ncbi:MAG: hypothetical protein LBI17_02735, partial [Rickettsiales bacterium]|nr:hypothetical protein [Rickettsiales bacterium]